MTARTKVLLDLVSEDTTGDAIPADGAAHTVIVDGSDFGSGTVTLQGSRTESGPWVTLRIAGSDATFTANAIRVMDFMGIGSWLRATLTGATNPVDVNVEIF